MNPNIPKEILDRIIWKKDKKLDGDPDEIEDFVHEAKQCEDCDRIITDRRIRMSICQAKERQPHIKQHCKNCGFYRNPQTGEWDLNFHQLDAIFRRPKSKSDK